VLVLVDASVGLLGEPCGFTADSDDIEVVSGVNGVLKPDGEDAGANTESTPLKDVSALEAPLLDCGGTGASESFWLVVGWTLGGDMGAPLGGFLFIAPTAVGDDLRCAKTSPTVTPDAAAATTVATIIPLAMRDIPAVAAEAAAAAWTPAAAEDAAEADALTAICCKTAIFL
jgi:hypothetical protein